MLSKLIICLIISLLAATLLFADDFTLGTNEVILEPSSNPVIISTLNGDLSNPFGRRLDTLYYDDGGGYWGYQGTSNALFYAVRFTPEEICTVQAGIYKVWKISGDWPVCTLYIWDDITGTPGPVVEGPVVDTSNSGWSRADFSGTYWELDDFWLGYWLPWWSPGDSARALTDHTADEPTRSAVGVNNGGVWDWTVGGLAGDLIIRAIVAYPTGETDISVSPDTIEFIFTPSDTDTFEMMQVSNIGNEWLFVDSIIAADPWVTIIVPSAFTVFPEHTVNVNVMVTKNGLSMGTHYTTLNIYSNDPNEAIYPEPVKFTLEVPGIEEAEDPVKNHKYAVNIFPNPMITEGKFVYSLPAKTDVEISIYDITGRLVRRLFKGSKKEGIYTVFWNRRDTNGVKVTQGVYIYNFIASEFRSTGNIVVIR